MQLEPQSITVNRERENASVRLRAAVAEAKLIRGAHGDGNGAGEHETASHQRAGKRNSSNFWTAAKRAMPPSLKRRLSGGRADDYEYWHARMADDGMNAPAWNPEGAVIAWRPVLDLPSPEEVRVRGVD